MSEPLGAPLPTPPDTIGRWLFHVARGFAAVGGVVLVAIALMSVASIASRFLTSKGLQGDFELVQLGCAVAVAAFLPWGQMRGSHVMVDFFTEGAGQRFKNALDALGALLVALCAALVAWRMVIGTLELRASQESSMLLGVPTWYATLLMTPSFALLALTALYSAWSKLQGRAQ
ncbi:TRAP transporter small permease [Rhodoferax sp.]|uniref:TRAP transporter small permease n=1 Tax=Rhodoferax sp. TaxID=50421 RepID=UPI002763CF1C|nr:TRAP transporter small permease [Rhodoferax sp.]